MSYFHGQPDLRPAGMKRVKIRDSLNAAWGKTQMMVPTQEDIEPIMLGQEVQQHPVPYLPSGLQGDHVSRTLGMLLLASQQGTVFYGDLVTPDPDDERYELIWRLVQQGAANPGNEEVYVPGIGKVFLDQRFWDYAERKKNAEMEAAYKLWKYQQLDLTTPELREEWIRRNPDFIPQLMKGKKKFMKTINRLADIRIKGIQSEEDMKFLWEVAMGVASPPLGQKFIPPKNAIEAQQFPGLKTPAGRPYPGVFGPKPQILEKTGNLVGPNAGQWNYRTALAESASQVVVPKKSRVLPVVGGTSPAFV